MAPRPPKPRDLCTLQEVLDRLQLPDATASRESVRNDLQASISAVSATIHRRSGREFVARNAAFENPADPVAGEIVVEPEARTLYADGRGWLAVGDLYELVDVDGDVDAATTWTLAYGERDGEGVRRLGYPGGWPVAGTAVVVTARWGWEEIPDDVREATVEEVARRWKRRTAKRPELQQDEAGAIDRDARELGVAYDTVMGYRPLGPILA